MTSEPVLASYQPPPPVVQRPNVVRFVQPHQRPSHIVLPVSLNDGPPRAFILDTGAPVTTVLVSKELLAIPAVAQKLQAAPPARIQGISGATATAYRTSARSIAVGSSRLTSFPYVLMAADRDLAHLGATPYGPVIGILGNDFLSQYRLTVDYQAHTITLEPR